jgi:hypothetical protein
MLDMEELESELLTKLDEDNTENKVEDETEDTAIDETDDNAEDAAALVDEWEFEPPHACNKIAKQIAKK